jgi:hypothetical protein
MNWSHTGTETIASCSVIDRSEMEEHGNVGSNGHAATNLGHGSALSCKSDACSINLVLSTYVCTPVDCGLPAGRIFSQFEHY